MLTGLEKAKALKELKQLRLDKAGQSGLALAKSLKRMKELRADLGMGGNAKKPITLTGKEFGDFDETPDGLIALREKAIEYLTNFRDDWVDCPALKGEAEENKVQIRDRGINHIQSYSSNRFKLMMLAKVKELINTGKLLYSEKNIKDKKKPNVTAYFYLKNEVIIDEKPFTPVLVIEKDDKGLLHYDILLDKYAKHHLDKALKVKGFDNVGLVKNLGQNQILMENVNGTDTQSQEIFDGLNDGQKNSDKGGSAKESDVLYRSMADSIAPKISLGLNQVTSQSYKNLLDPVNKSKDLGVPAGEESYDSSPPTLPKSSSNNLSDSEIAVNMFDKSNIDTDELEINIFFEREFSQFKDSEQSSNSPTNPLQAILNNLQSGTLTPADLDVAEIDHLIFDKTPENEAILGQIMDIVTDSYQEKV